MAKNKRELQVELEAANKRIAKLSQSNQNANSNINNEKPPSHRRTQGGGVQGSKPPLKNGV